jgi:hypothetical protein
MLRNLILVGAVMLALAGCASGPTVRAVSDPQADFTAFRTFGFASPLGTDRNGFVSQVSSALMLAARREMEARGLVYAAENPQLLVNFNAQLADRVRIDQQPSSMMRSNRGFYSYRGGLYAPFPSWQDQTTVRQYREGTINIDVANAATRQLVWEGVVSQTMGSRENSDLIGAIDRAVTAAFVRFPIARPAAGAN